MSKKSDKPQPSSTEAAAARERQRMIGRRLQSFFDDTIQEGVPDEFAKLLDQLDEAEQARSGSGPGSSDAGPDKPRNSGGAR